MKTHYLCDLRVLLTAVMTASCFMVVSADNLHAQTPIAPPTTHGIDPALAQQLSQLQARVAQLEAALAKNTPAMAAPPTAVTPPPAMAGMSAGPA